MYRMWGCFHRKGPMIRDLLHILCAMNMVRGGRVRHLTPWGTPIETLLQSVQSRGADWWGAQVRSDRVAAKVVLVKPEYLVAALPRRREGVAPTLGFLATRDFNLLAAAEAGRRFEAGQTLAVTVSQLPSEETGVERLLPVQFGGGLC